MRSARYPLATLSFPGKAPVIHGRSLTPSIQLARSPGRSSSNNQVRFPRARRPQRGRGKRLGAVRMGATPST
jgi:hypothetical protein